MLADKRKDGYAICFNEWSLDKEIKNDLGLLLIISGLTSKNGVCFASNEYFAALFNITTISVSRKIKNLEKAGYITLEYEKRGCEVTRRNIRLTKMLTDGYQKRQPTVNKNVKENNTSNIKKSTIKKERKKTDAILLLEIWNTVTGGYYNIGRFVKSINAPLKQHGLEKTGTALRAYLRDQKREAFKYASVESFVRSFGRWAQTIEEKEIDPTSD